MSSAALDTSESWVSLSGDLRLRWAWTPFDGMTEEDHEETGARDKSEGGAEDKDGAGDDDCDDDIVEEGTGGETEDEEDGFESREGEDERVGSSSC